MTDIDGDGSGPKVEVDQEHARREQAVRAELDSIGDYLAEYGPRLPLALLEEQRRIAEALG